MMCGRVDIGLNFNLRFINFEFHINFVISLSEQLQAKRIKTLIYFVVINFFNVAKQAKVFLLPSTVLVRAWMLALDVVDVVVLIL